MNYRILGKTGYKISEVSFGGWAIGGSWGKVDDNISMKALEEAVDNGINFFDTADIYGDGRSERLIGKLSNNSKEKIYIATKAGRRLNPHTAEQYTINNIRSHVERSLQNLKVECLDLLQLHCPPTEVYYNEELFHGLSEMKKEGLIANYGVSVKKIEEALKAIEYEDVSTVQIVFNMFRHKPAEEFLGKAKENNIGVIARVPLASGLLTGKMNKDTVFEKKDHRFYNKNGESFGLGETFSGVNYETGLEAVEVLKKIKPEGMTLAQFALKWILMNDGISCVIPGGKTPEQIRQNAETCNVKEISPNVMKTVTEIYDQYIKEQVHNLC